MPLPESEPENEKLALVLVAGSLGFDVMLIEGAVVSITIELEQAEIVEFPPVSIVVSL
jgi:hypothetical protein